jgi:hypothetical protein
MSRERERQRKKRSELARQLGVTRGELADGGAIEQRERVTRPALQLQSRNSTGLLGRLHKELPLVAALYLVDAKGARLVRALVLDGDRQEIEKLVYRRPAHFIIVLLETGDPGAVINGFATAQLRLDDLDLASDAFASAEWEVARRVRVAGLKGEHSGAALSIRGVTRVAARHEFPLERCIATLSIEI